MADNVQAYAVYRTVAFGEQPIGYVVNRVLWNGQSEYIPGAGLELISDPTNTYPIGSVYSAASS